MRRLPIILTLALTLGISAAAQSGNSQKKARLEREIAILDQQLKENAGKVRSANTALNLTRKKITARKGLVAESDALIANLNRRIADKNAKIDSLEKRFDLLSGNYCLNLLLVYHFPAHNVK